MLELDYTNVLESTIGLSHGIPKIAFDKASESSKHVVEHIRPSGGIERPERHRGVIRIEGVNKEDTVIDRERLVFPSLLPHPETALGRRDLDLAVRPSIDACEAAEVARAAG